MSLFDSRNLTKQILDLLGAERIILLSGRLEKLTDISSKKEKIIAQVKVSAGTLDAVSINKILTAAKANELLYKSAKKGLEAVLDRFDGVSSQGKAFQTYDPNGQRLRSQSAIHEIKA